MSSHNITKEELGLAVKILHGQSIRSWSKTIIKPNTNRPISHSAIYAALNDETPPWLLNKLIGTVRRAKRQAPKAFEGEVPAIDCQPEQTLQND